METSARILVLGGLSVLSYGFLLGFGMAGERTKAPHASRYLLAAHLAAIIQGTLLLALTVAVGVSTLSAGLETLAAYLFVVGIAFFLTGLTLNWRRGVRDGFAERSLGNRVTSIGVPLILAGTALLFTGVVRGV